MAKLVQSQYVILCIINSLACAYFCKIYITSHRSLFTPNFGFIYVFALFKVLITCAPLKSGCRCCGLVCVSHTCLAVFISYIKTFQLIQTNLYLSEAWLFFLRINICRIRRQQCDNAGGFVVVCTRNCLDILYECMLILLIMVLTRKVIKQSGHKVCVFV